MPRLAAPTTLTERRTTGFRSLRPGRIHVRCPRCGVKRSNTPRGEDDPPTAALCEVECPKCGMGGFPTPEFFDAAGTLIDLSPPESVT